MGDRQLADTLAQRIAIAVGGDEPAWHVVRGWALELAQTAERLQDPDTHRNRAAGVDHDAIGDALKAAMGVLTERLDEPAAVLVVQNGQPRQANYGRTVAATIANPWDLLRTIVDHNDPRGGPRARL
jgi:hypothetical protein